MRKLFTAIATLAACLIFAMSSYAGTWILDNVGWWWQNDDGSWPASRWEWLDGNRDGLAECYYFDNRGYCMLSGVTPDGYNVNSSGAWVENGIVQIRYMRGHSSSSGSGGSGSASAAAASAAGSVSNFNDVSGGTPVLQLNEGDTMIRSLNISGKTLTLKGIPADSQFNYVWFTLEDATGERVYDEIRCRQGSNLSFDLSGVSPGTYMICVYVNPERYSSFTAVLYREIYLTVTRTGMSLSGDSAIAVNAARSNMYGAFLTFLSFLGLLYRRTVPIRSVCPLRLSTSPSLFHGESHRWRDRPSATLWHSPSRCFLPEDARPSD